MESSKNHTLHHSLTYSYFPTQIYLTLGHQLIRKAIGVLPRIVPYCDELKHGTNAF